MSNILITGRPGVGKTTLIKKLAEALGDSAGGFYTEETREGGVRTGFSLTTLDGKHGVLARVGAEGPHRVGKYAVDLSDLETIGVPAVRSAVEARGIVLIDEIGRMELFSRTFRNAVVDALDSICAVVATIQMRSERFLDSVRSRDDVEIIEVTLQNRDLIVESLYSAVRR